MQLRMRICFLLQHQEGLSIGRSRLNAAVSYLSMMFVLPHPRRRECTVSPTRDPGGPVLAEVWTEGGNGDSAGAAAVSAGGWRCRIRLERGLRAGR